MVGTHKSGTCCIFICKVHSHHMHDLLLIAAWHNSSISIAAYFFTRPTNTSAANCVFWKVCIEYYHESAGAEFKHEPEYASRPGAAGSR
jgi:hypothetical protein